MDSIITVNNISFFYKNLQALKDIFFYMYVGNRPNQFIFLDQFGHCHHNVYKDISDA